MPQVPFNALTLWLGDEKSVITNNSYLGDLAHYWVTPEKEIGEMDTENSNSRGRTTVSHDSRADQLYVYVVKWKNTPCKYGRQMYRMLPDFPLNVATSRKVGKLSTMSCSSFMALPSHSAMTLTKLPPNLYTHTAYTHTHTQHTRYAMYTMNCNYPRDNGLEDLHTHTNVLWQL